MKEIYTIIYGLKIPDENIYESCVYSQAFFDKEELLQIFFLTIQDLKEDIQPRVNGEIKEVTYPSGYYRLRFQDSNGEYNNEVFCYIKPLILDL